MGRFVWTAAALLAGVRFAYAGPVDPAAGLGKTYADAIRAVNEQHARSPGKTREPELAKKVPKAARAALASLLQGDESPARLDAILAAGEAALELDLLEDFEKILTRLEKSSPERAARLGRALSRSRFLLRGIGAFKEGYLERFADVLDAVLDAYDGTFGFAEWSKVPGKKLRVKLRLVEKITDPPHFAPQFPFHSEIDFPVADAEKLTSPTPDGKFLFYGLCHELGHVVAMWGNGDKTRREDDDHHAWAHYTGVVIVERLAKEEKSARLLEGLRDARWRSLELERKALEGRAPSFADREGVLALLLALHDKVGPRAIGDAINRLDREDHRLRINRVRYYTFRELREALLKAPGDPNLKKDVQALLRDAPR